MSASKPEDHNKIEELVPPTPRKYEIKYSFVTGFAYLHIAALYGLYLCFTSAKWQTILWVLLNNFLCGIGISAGAHRLWTHRTYKGTLLLRIFLMLCYSMSYQKTLITWIKLHRLHHKYTDTDADPHNSIRGLFYSHIGWVMVHRHPDIVARGKSIDMSDIYADPVVTFQSRNAYWFLPLCAFAIPTLIPMWLWNETFNNAFNMNVLRIICVLHRTFLVNSVAHKWGYKPFDISVSSTESLPIFWATYGEGFHNFHHAFPNDYRIGELSTQYFNYVKYLIDFWAFLGLAYDLKITSQDMIEAKAKRTGDGTYVSRLKNKDC